MYVVFEGYEGSGKSTFARAVVSKLKAEGVNVVHVTEPMDIGVPYRTLLQNNELPCKAQALLFYANRVVLMQQIKQHLAEGAIVVSDRSHISSHAIQKRTLANMGQLDMDEFFMELDAFVEVQEPSILFHVIGCHRDAKANPSDKLEASVVKAITRQAFAEELVRVCDSYEDTKLVTLNNAVGQFDGCLTTVMQEIKCFGKATNAV